MIEERLLGSSDGILEVFQTCLKCVNIGDKVTIVLTFARSVALTIWKWGQFGDELTCIMLL